MISAYHPTDLTTKIIFILAKPYLLANGALYRKD